MANYYTSALASGGGSGSEVSPWTLAEAIADINAATTWVDGDTLYIKNDGKYTTTGIAITNAGTTTAYSKIIGYTSIITDGGIPEIERSGGTGVLFDVSAVNYWKISNLELDGQNGGTINLSTKVSNIHKRIIIHNAGTAGANIGTYINCYSYSNVSYGFSAGGNYLYCISKDNGNTGFQRPYGCYNCISIDNPYNFETYQNTILHNCISVGGANGGIYITYFPCAIYNAIITDVPINKYAIAIAGGYKGADIQNINFYNIASGSAYYCQDTTLLGTYYELDPQFSNPNTLDFRRTGTNLDDKGFSIVGLQAFDYKIDIGIDQGAPDYPAITDVRDNVIFGGGTGSLDLPSIDDVRDGTFFDNATKEGLLDLPSTFYVKKGIVYDNGTKVGTYALASGMSYSVILNFNDGTNSYDFPLLQSISDPIPSMKATIIEGGRSNGSIIIPGGQKSIEIIVRGILYAGDYQQINDLINEMRTKVTTSPATLTLKFWTGAAWSNSWAYAVRRIEEINFPESMRVLDQEYSVRFLVFSY